eukprot:g2653.t1
MLWVDKHRPKRLDKMDFHKELSSRLVSLATTGDIPHMVFYGPTGAGKKTRVMALLRQLFGPGVQKTKVENLTFKTASGRKVEISALGSNYHTELNPGDAGLNDKLIVQEVIKNMAQCSTLHSSVLGSHSANAVLSSSNANFSSSASISSLSDSQGASGAKAKPKYKVLVLTEVGSLSHTAQHALRRTMEKYASSCRLILICNSLCSVIEPVRSRCLAVRVPAPTEEQICSVLTEVCRREQLKLPSSLAMRVARESCRNIRVALLSLEACKVRQYPFSIDQQVAKADWKQFIIQLAKDIMREQSPSNLLATRKKLYELLVNCIPAQTVLRELTNELLKNADNDLKAEICRWAAHYSHNLRKGNKEIFHLEAFVAQYMSLYKSFLLELGM